MIIIANVTSCAPMLSYAIVCQQFMEEISYSGGPSPIRKKLSKRILLFGVFFVIILLLLGGVFYFVTRGNSESETSKTITLPQDQEPTIEESETPTPEPTEAATEETPTKTPTKAPSQSTNENQISVAVQNGSGESGVAAKAAEILKGAGYTIASTGNADNFDYTNVTIRVKASKKSILADLESALSSDYTIGDTSTDLSEGQSYDALVIIGK